MADIVIPAGRTTPIGTTRASDDEKNVLDAGSRGTTTIAQRVIERIAATAALESGDVVRRRSRGVLSPIVPDALASSTTSVKLAVHHGHVRGTVDATAVWPAPAKQAADDVRGRVIRALSEYTGVAVDALDVHLHYTFDPSVSARKRVR